MSLDDVPPPPPSRQAPLPPSVPPAPRLRPERYDPVAEPAPGPAPEPYLPHPLPRRAVAERTWPSGRRSGRRSRRRSGRRVLATVVAAALVVCGVGVYRLVGGEAPTSTAVDRATGLAPELMRRFEAARDLAAQDGVELTLTSGWRSAKDQAQIVETMVDKHGAVEAKRWVLPPETSGHVAGEAIDVGATEGALWLGQHGAEVGLCQTYANEMWHFEAVIEPGGTCPEMHEDSRGGWE